MSRQKCYPPKPEQMQGMNNRALPAAAYRALRWNAGELAPGATTQVVARVKITDQAGVEALSPK